MSSWEFLPFSDWSSTLQFFTHREWGTQLRTIGPFTMREENLHFRRKPEKCDEPELR